MTLPIPHTLELAHTEQGQQRSGADADDVHNIFHRTEGLAGFFRKCLDKAIAWVGDQLHFQGHCRPYPGKDDGQGQKSQPGGKGESLNFNGVLGYVHDSGKKDAQGELEQGEDERPPIPRDNELHHYIDQKKAQGGICKGDGEPEGYHKRDGRQGRSSQTGLSGKCQANRQNQHPEDITDNSC